MPPAATPAINLVPSELTLKTSIGASVAIRMNVFKKDGQPFILTPYNVTAPFVSGGGMIPPVGAWTLVVEESAIHLSLAKADTLAMAPAGSITWHWTVWLDNTTAPESLLLAHGDLGLLDP
jgi:hypothetical protein